MTSIPAALRMEQAQYDAIRKHGEETYPYECCGVLLGHSEPDANLVVDAVRAGNVRTDSAHNRYQIAPQELVRIQREARQQGLDIVGFYHSHPDHPAQWSRTDLAEAHWLGCSYVITSVLGPQSTGRCRAAETNAFLLAGSSEEDKRLEKQAIEVQSAEPVAVS
ncbi:MAG TPA: M67 family metallopeptidase [Acidobacteriaceae bacterium]|nr:M67 family metallopeptidase [Acidobacteriaceae bacterium]